jgi:hypothetical protein
MELANLDAQALQSGWGVKPWHTKHGKLIFGHPIGSIYFLTLWAFACTQGLLPQP